MHKLIHNRVMRLAALPLLWLHLGACMSTDHVPPAEISNFDNIVGVTTRAGAKIPFSTPGAKIIGDTLHAAGEHGAIAIPTDSVRYVWDREISSAKTVGLVIGVGLLIAAVVAAGHSSSGGTSGRCCGGN